MISDLQAALVKPSELNDGVFELKKNTPKQIGKESNSYIARIHEEEGEDCFIHSQFCDEAFAVICREFYLNFYKNPKRVDLSYYYFAENKTAMVYLYDMKKTFAGIDVMIHLIEQWRSSICDAKYCIEKTGAYQLACPQDIHIGVITENDDVERRERELQPILHPEPPLEGLPSFIKNKHRANTADQIAKFKLLTGFDEGKVTIGGITYDYDVRTFMDKQHHMYFNNGVLERQTVE